jgi:hypothetical protein
MKQSTYIQILRIWKDEEKEEIEAAMYCTTCKVQTIREVVVDKAVNNMIKLGRWMVLLDNQADMSIMHP